MYDGIDCGYGSDSGNGYGNCYRSCHENNGGGDFNGYDYGSGNFIEYFSVTMLLVVTVIPVVMTNEMAVIMIRLSNRS